jgi:peptide subunit release factor RF-3
MPENNTYRETPPFGGAIQEAGAVKNNKIKKGATSDFMEIERREVFRFPLRF